MDLDKETLDPVDWEETRKVGHQMIDDMIAHYQSMGDNPVWQEMPVDHDAYFKVVPPEEGATITEVYNEFATMVMPYIMGNPHPRFWAWYMGSSTMTGAMADFLTSATNSNAGAGNHVGQYIEDQVIDWMKEIVGYDSDAAGILVSGGSMANFVGIAVARHQHAGYDIRTEGIRVGEHQMTIYASSEVHSCNQKAAELLGLGSKHLRKVAVNDDYTINMEALKQAIDQDRALGYLPICVIASAGTVNTGAIDDLNAIADLCQEEGLWYHVDGAIGAIAMISDEAKKQLKGIERSDSVALDLHKWLHIPFEAGCVLVKDKKGHRDTFNLTPEYLAQNVRGLASGTGWYSEYGLQLSRRLKALKVWMCIKEQGTAKLGRMITKNISQAQYLGSLIEDDSELELMAPVGLDIVCYRYVPRDDSKYDLNALNKEILILLHERGHAVPSYTTLNGQYCIRVAIANHRSTKEDFDFLADKTTSIGAEIKSSYLDMIQ